MNSLLLKVEIRVVNQLAAAYEQQVIKHAVLSILQETNETGTPSIKLQVSNMKETSRKETSNPL